MPDAASTRQAAALPTCLPLRVRDLGYAVAGKRLIDGLELKIEQPGVSVVMGPNGAGKSLLLRLLHGLLEPTAGSIEWGGRALDAAVRREQAMVFQKPVLLRRSVAANIEFVLGRKGRDWRERRDLILHDAGRWRGRWRPARGCCCSTSPAPASIRPRPSRSKPACARSARRESRFCS